jgi:leucyl-tRNA synthetase
MALLTMLSPFAPFVSEELWHRVGGEGRIAKTAWPSFDPALTVQEAVTMVVQVNGKVRDRMDVPATITEEEMTARATASEKVRALTDGKTVVKTVVVRPKLVNIVVK